MVKSPKKPATEVATAMMRATICEYATIHVDGTFTIVRGGVTALDVAAALPQTLAFHLILELAPGTLPKGSSPFSVHAGPKGLPPVTKLEGVISTVKPQEWGRYVIPVQVPVSSLGTYSIEVTAGKYKSEVNLELRPPPSAASVPPASVPTARA